MMLSAMVTLKNQIVTFMNAIVEIKNRLAYVRPFSDFMCILESEASGKSIPSYIRSIEFRNVSFKYPHSSDYALKEINFKVKPNQKIAIVGKNGSGKTTLIKLLMRFYQPSEGSIFLNGVDINEYDIKEYRKLFSTVFQDYSTFAFTLGENISLNNSYDTARMNVALEKSGLLSLVKRCPNGLATHISRRFNDNGIDFSGGELQKIAIARAIYKDGQLLVLDEPNAAMDSKSEIELYSNISSFSIGKIVLFITHRLASVLFCDRILVLKDGKLVGDGEHANLIDTVEEYRTLFNAQKDLYKDTKIERN